MPAARRAGASSIGIHLSRASRASAKSFSSSAGRSRSATWSSFAEKRRTSSSTRSRLATQMSRHILAGAMRVKSRNPGGEREEPASRAAPLRAPERRREDAADGYRRKYRVVLGRIHAAHAPHCFQASSTMLAASALVSLSGVAPHGGREQLGVRGRGAALSAPAMGCPARSARGSRRAPCARWRRRRAWCRRRP